MKLLSVLASVLCLVGNPSFSDDLENRVRVLRSLADEGDADAQLELGQLLLSQIEPDVDSDYSEVTQYIQAAAEAGHLQAQNQLGVLYRDYLGEENSWSLAAQWFRSAAERGLGDAQRNLAYQFENGYGLPEDQVQAAYWYQLAAAQDDEFAIVSIAAMYREGRGLQQNLDEAFRHYQMAASFGDHTSQVRLSEMYADGSGGVHSPVLAYMWASIAFEDGHWPAEQWLDELDENLSVDQVREAHRLAEECITQDLLGCV